jgi:hypothetical protein
LHAGVHDCESLRAVTMYALGRAALRWFVVCETGRYGVSIGTTRARGEGPVGGGPPSGSGYAYAQGERGSGWVAFAGVLLLILGVLNTIEGIAAIGNAHFFSHNAHYILGSLNRV